MSFNQLYGWVPDETNWQTLGLRGITGVPSIQNSSMPMTALNAFNQANIGGTPNFALPGSTASLNGPLYQRPPAATGWSPEYNAAAAYGYDPLAAAGAGGAGIGGGGGGLAAGAAGAGNPGPYNWAAGAAGAAKAPGLAAEAGSLFFPGLRTAEGAWLTGGNLAKGIVGTAGKASIPLAVGQVLGSVADKFNIGGQNSNWDRGISSGLKGAGIGAAIGTVFPGPGTLIGAGLGAAAGSIASILWGNHDSTAQKLDKQHVKDRDALQTLMKDSNLTPDHQTAIMHQYDMAATDAISRKALDELKALGPQARSMVFQADSADTTAQADLAATTKEQNRQIALQFYMQSLLPQVMKPFMDKGTVDTNNNVAIINQQAAKATALHQDTIAAILTAQAANLQSSNQNMQNAILAQGVANPYGLSDPYGYKSLMSSPSADAARQAAIAKAYQTAGIASATSGVRAQTAAEQAAATKAAKTALAAGTSASASLYPQGLGTANPVSGSNLSPQAQTLNALLAAQPQ